jgi:signal transduction histidine kinase
LSGVIGLGEIMLQQPELSPQSKEIAGRIFGSSKQLLYILNELLDFSRLESGKVSMEITRFSVAPLINQIVGLVKVDAEAKGLQISVNVSGEVPAQLEGDEGKLRQIILNLVSNAIKFTEKGGVQIAVDSIPDKKQVRFAVIDTGVGIPLVKQQQLFSPFVQADNSTQRIYGGSGLGLSIAKRYVEMMSGSIELKSSEGEGTAVWFTVPEELRVTGR